jgi:hypothetical protein
MIGVTGLPSYRTADHILSLFFKMVNTVEVVIHTIFTLPPQISCDQSTVTIHVSFHSTAVILAWLIIAWFTLDRWSLTKKYVQQYSLCIYTCTLLLLCIQWRNVILSGSTQQRMCSMWHFFLLLRQSETVSLWNCGW